MKITSTLPFLPQVNRPLFLLPIALAFLFAGAPSAWLPAQSDSDAENSVFDLLSRTDEVIQLTLRTDMNELIENRLRDDYQPAQLTFTNKKGEDTQFDVDVIPRGKYRRRICDFPPVMLNFSKSRLRERGLKGEYDKIKLVTYCLEETEAESYLLKEYLTYKIYNLLTPNSYRVQLARMTYKDSKGQREEIEQFGILIEDTDEMAHRIGGAECECLNYPPDSIAMAEENKMAVFQYMIGNEDWSVMMLRNVKMIRPYDGEKIIPVPYDFDFSGLVNTSYALPRTQLGMTNIQQRKFLGIPTEQRRLDEALQAFDRQEESIKELIKNFEELPKTERNKMAWYVNTFYKKKVRKQLAEEALRNDDAPSER